MDPPPSKDRFRPDRRIDLHHTSFRTRIYIISEPYTRHSGLDPESRKTAVYTLSTSTYINPYIHSPPNIDRATPKKFLHPAKYLIILIYNNDIITIINECMSQKIRDRKDPKQLQYRQNNDSLPLENI